MRVGSTVTIVLLCAVLSITSRSRAGSRVPESRTFVKGLTAPAEILIDRWGVPHIYARTAHDAFLSQGWNAARDRLWQIDLWRRTGLGQLAEALGPSYVSQDKAIRLFVYRGDIAKEWAAYGVDAKRNTEAFVAGINGYVAATRRNPALLPSEFKLAGYFPALWKAEDVVRVRDHGLAGNVFLQVLRAQIACQTGNVASSSLLYKISPPWTPVVPQGLDLCSIPGDVLRAYGRALSPVSVSGSKAGVATNAAQIPYVDFALDFGRLSQGSNNWVVAPNKSTTGRPILANDPHRALEVPSLRYLAHLVAPGLNVIGAGEPALPGISIGHNEHIAFGITVFPIAQEDLYVYETNPSNPNEYRYRDGWESMRVAHESIAVREGPDVQTDLKFTRHGPVILEDPAHHRAYALRATWLDTGGAPYFDAVHYLRAKNVQEFRAALKHWGEPGENQVYADTRGNIGWFPAGFTPHRRNSDGLLPLPGDGRYEWDNYLDRDELPSEVNPARGYVATANQMNLPKDYPYAQRRVSFFWDDGTRFARIRQVLDGLMVSPQASEALQNDSLNLQALRLIRILGRISTPEPELRDTIQWLKDWDARVTVESPQAALYEVWCAHHLVSAALAQVLPNLPEGARDLSGMTVPEGIVELLERPDTRLGPEPESARDELMLRSLAEALKETQHRLGPDRSHWQWGKLSSVQFEHPFAPLADPALKVKMNVGPAPKGGDAGVVGFAGYGTQDFRTEMGASFRMVLDVGHWDESVAVNTPGQSGDPLSPHYRDLFPLWLDGKYFPLVYSRAAVEQATEQRIVLLPAN